MCDKFANQVTPRRTFKFDCFYSYSVLKYSINTLTVIKSKFILLLFTFNCVFFQEMFTYQHFSPIQTIKHNILIQLSALTPRRDILGTASFEAVCDMCYFLCVWAVSQHAGHWRKLDVTSGLLVFRLWRVNGQEGGLAWVTSNPVAINHFLETFPPITSNHFARPGGGTIKTKRTWFAYIPLEL